MLGRVVGRDLREPPAHLGRDDQSLAGPLSEEPAEQLLAVTVAVDIGRVKEGDADICRRMQGTQARQVVDLTPAASDRPRTKADGADVVAGLAESSILHADASLGTRVAMRQATWLVRGLVRKNTPGGI